MIRNYLIIALRNLARHKLYSFINIAGLTVGLTCAIFIILFVRDQLSYDRWIPGTENLYRVEETLNTPGKPPTAVRHDPFPAGPGDAGPDSGGPGANPADAQDRRRS